MINEAMAKTFEQENVNIITEHGGNMEALHNYTVCRVKDNKIYGHRNDGHIKGIVFLNSIVSIQPCFS